jgi:RimJ/RimL family protein N-acetyltransferase
VKDYLETERLRLRNLSESDAEFAIELLNSPGWLKYIGDRGVKDVASAKAYIRERVLNLYEQYGYGPYGVMTKDSDELMGFCGLFKREFLEDPDIGFAFLPEFTGRGYAFESAAAVMNEVRNDPRLKRVSAITTTGNYRSINLLTKLGLKFEKMIPYPGEKEELMLYSIELH